METICTAGTLCKEHSFSARLPTVRAETTASTILSFRHSGAGSSQRTGEHLPPGRLTNSGACGVDRLRIPIIRV
ncbi:hypothetical protein AALG83_08995 [Christensenellaceae bacterium 44-20]